MCFSDLAGAFLGDNFFYRLVAALIVMNMLVRDQVRASESGQAIEELSISPVRTRFTAFQQR
jgi:hypothetical protein